MTNSDTEIGGRLIQVISLACKDGEHAQRCIEALANCGRPDALVFNCVSDEFGLRDGSSDTAYIIERWRQWSDLGALLEAKVVPALPMYNQLLKKPFDPSTDTLRITLSREQPVG
jgi:hypothetical protein